MESTIICVFDTETTGLSKDRDRIISIAASCRGAEFSSFVRPKIRIPPRYRLVYKHLSCKCVR